MTTLSPQEIKKALVAEGFEVFRILEGQVVLADRVRENLILDSGVRLVPQPMAIVVIFRVQQSDFPSEDQTALFERARDLAKASRAQGFDEHGTAVAPVHDPADGSRILDTFFEVSMSRRVDSLADAFHWLKVALAFEKTTAS